MRWSEVVGRRADEGTEAVGAGMHADCSSCRVAQASMAEDLQIKDSRGKGTVCAHEGSAYAKVTVRGADRNTTVLSLLDGVRGYHARTENTGGGREHSELGCCRSKAAAAV